MRKSLTFMRNYHRAALMAGIVGSLILAGCRTETLVGQPPASSSQGKTSKTPPALSEKQVVAMGGQLMDDALGVAETCRLEGRSGGGDIVALDFVVDTCKPSKDQLQKLITEANKLTSSARPNASQDELDFIAAAGRFRDWSATIEETSHTQGTCAAYKQLARAWNRWQPEHKRPVDPKQALHDYFEKMPGTGSHYMARSEGAYAKRRARAKALHWTTCMEGPCLLWVPREPKK